MPRKLSELLEVFEDLWPESGADVWDRVGLVAGSKDQSVTRALMCVDPTLEVIKEANEKSCQLLISHHPLLLDGVHSVAEGEPKGDILSFAITNSIAIFTAHTNADIVPGGVSDTLAEALGLQSSIPLVPTTNGSGHGRIGTLGSPQTLEQFAKNALATLPGSNAPIRVAGDPTRMIQRVAVVGGSGGGFLSDAVRAGADCFVTSDLKHHLVLDVVSNTRSAIAIIDISHFGAESLWLKPAALELSKQVSGVEFLVSEVSTDPWSMSLTEGNK